jgi:hypothetical protein
MELDMTNTDRAPQEHDQNERDDAALQEAVTAGRVVAGTGL